MNNNSTHIIRHYAAKFGPDKRPSISQLYRSNDQMVIGIREGVKVAWGEDPKAQQGRAFASEEAALKFLRRIADLDQGVRKGHVCKACGFAPAELMVCPENNDGAHRIDHDPSARIEEIDGESRVARLN
jgi:hypothetical protein